MLLSGLKKYGADISAIVSMADDGGSTGRLRDELGVLPPGDVRQCLVALSDESEKMRELFNYRFENGGLEGHNFGNIFLSALEKISGSFSEGVNEAIKILGINGKVIPVTDDNANLFIKLKNGKEIKGENEINHNHQIEKIGVRRIYLKPKAMANREALEAIEKADLIVIGPGNHYCSIVPNFLVDGVSEAIRKSKAKVVYNCNLVSKKGHNEKFSLDDHVDLINEFIGEDRIDFVTFNTKRPKKELIEKYKEKGEKMLRFGKRDREKRGYRIIGANLLSSKEVKYSKSDKLANTRSFIRHDSEKLAKVLVMILEMEYYQKFIREIA